MACESQWNWSVGMKAIRTGLNYTALESVMRMMGISRSARSSVFEGVRLMESETIKVQAEQLKS